MKTEPGVEEEPPEKKPRISFSFTDDIFDLDDEDGDEDVRVLSHEELSQAEMERYLAEPRAKGKSLDILQWWKEHQMVYPYLARVARKYLAIPASSTPSERVFSACGNLVCKKRARISHEMVDQMIFLNKNMKKL